MRALAAATKTIGKVALLILASAYGILFITAFAVGAYKDSGWPGVLIFLAVTSYVGYRCERAMKARAARNPKSGVTSRSARQVCTVPALQPQFVPLVQDARSVLAPFGTAGWARRTLGLTEAQAASRILIQVAWKARLQSCHPDAGGSDEAAQGAGIARDILACTA